MDQLHMKKTTTSVKLRLSSRGEKNDRKSINFPHEKIARVAKLSLRRFLIMFGSKLP